MITVCNGNNGPDELQNMTGEFILDIDSTGQAHFVESLVFSLVT